MFDNSFVDLIARDDSSLHVGCRYCSVVTEKVDFVLLAGNEADDAI